MRNTIYLFFAILIAGTAASESLSGQALVSYGHGVAKAAGAGAAAGAGIGGVLTGLRNPLARATEGRNGTAAGRASAVRRTAPQRRGDIRWDLGPQGFGSPAPLGLVGGVRATGGTDPNWQPQLLAPNQNLTVLNVDWGSPTDEAASSDEPDPAVEADQTASSEAEEEMAEEDPEEDRQTVIRAANGRPVSASRAPSQTASDLAPRIPEGVAVGLTIEELIAKLGRPQLAFRGVAGTGYTDQYVFELPDGADLVVYALDGVVAHVAVT